MKKQRPGENTDITTKTCLKKKNSKKKSRDQKRITKGKTNKNPYPSKINKIKIK